MNEDIIITLKIKGDSQKFQDNYEIEYSLSNFDVEKFNQINKYLQDRINVNMPKLENMKNIQAVIDILKRAEFDEYRMFSQKKQKKYINGSFKITIDTFPENIGKYLEIETGTEEELFSLVDILELDKEKVEKRNYGEIIKEKRKDLDEYQRRTCIFK